MNTYSRQLLMRAVLIEGTLLGVASIWAYLQDMPWRQVLTPTIRSGVIGICAGLVLLFMNYLVIEYGARKVSFLQIIKQLIEEDVSPLFENVHLLVIVLIAMLSGFAEEVFFRGILQHHLGLWFASVIFGLTHIWKKIAISYGVYATFIGLYLGGLYLLTENLWTPITTHAVNNLVAILYMRMLVKSKLANDEDFS